VLAIGENEIATAAAGISTTSSEAFAVDPVSKSNGVWLEIVPLDEFKNARAFVGVTADATE
jgi:hypothetical protein